MKYNIDICSLRYQVLKCDLNTNHTKHIIFRFISAELLSRHETLCMKHAAQSVSFPEEGSVTKFEAWSKTIPHPIIISKYLSIINLSLY